MLRLVNRQRRERVPVAWLSRVARCAARRLKVAWRGELVVSFLNDRTMQRLNWRFLRHRGVTDVLTFRYSHEPLGRALRSARHFLGRQPIGCRHSLAGKDMAGSVAGEILIAPAFAKRYARQHGLEYREELARYVVHGLLHWVGREDQTAAQQRRMRQLEDRLLNHCGVQ